MLCVQTASATLLRNRYCVSSHNFRVTVGREVVAILRVNPILVYRDCTQPLVMQNPRYWPYFARLLLIRPIRTSYKTCLFIVPPAVLNFIINERSLKSSSSGNKSSLLRFGPICTSCGTICSVFFHCDRYLVSQPRTVLSVNLGNSFLNLFTAFVVPQ